MCTQKYTDSKTLNNDVTYKLKDCYNVAQGCLSVQKYVTTTNNYVTMILYWRSIMYFDVQQYIQMLQQCFDVPYDRTIE